MCVRRSPWGLALILPLLAACGDKPEPKPDPTTAAAPSDPAAKADDADKADEEKPADEKKADAADEPKADAGDAEEKADAGNAEKKPDDAADKPAATKTAAADEAKGNEAKGDAKPTGPTAGKPWQVVASVQAEPGYKCNDEYPHKFVTSGGSNVTYPNAKPAGGCAGKRAIAVTVPYVPTAEGPGSVAGTMKYGICDDAKTNCRIVKKQMSFNFTAK